MKRRIWELDAFRGICILGMILVHLGFDVTELYGFVDWAYPPLFSLIKDWGGICFILLSGVCATLGSRSLRRGVIVFSCGMLCTLVTLGMYLLGLADKSILIWFGVLHCLGLCMVAWSLFRRLSTGWLALTGSLLAVLGFVFRMFPVSTPLLFPLGLVSPSFSSADYFPLLPHLGFFLLGAVLGRTVYREKTTRFPRVNASQPALRFLCWCGRQSLLIYLLHQPVLMGIFQIVEFIK